MADPEVAPYRGPVPDKIVDAHHHFRDLPTAMLGGVAAAAGLALINSLANLSGFLGPWIIGRVSDATGGTAPAILFLGATLVVGAGLIPRRLVDLRRAR